MKVAAREYPTIDLLRIVAIMMTVLAHVTSITFTLPVLREFRWGMWLGVDLFMLISGWLLGGQLLRQAERGSATPWRFYFKRWMRTLPPYYAMLIILYLGREGGMQDATLGDLALHFAFVQEYAERNQYMVSWSLCVEEHFYLLLPLIVWAIPRMGRAWFLFALVAGVELVAVVLRVVAFPPESGAAAPMITHLRWHGLFVGLLFAYLAHTRSPVWTWLGRWAAWLGVAGIGLTLLLMGTLSTPPNEWMFVVVPTLGTWTLALVFIPCVHSRSSWSRFTFPGLRYLGELTYALYLVHSVIPKAWLGDKVTESPVQGFVVRFGLMIGCAMLLHHLIEAPALRLREWILERWGRTDVGGSERSAGAEARAPHQ